MSEQVQPEEQYECSMCGHDGGPYAACELCRGNTRFLQSKSYTLTEERTGQNPDAGKRYGKYGEVNPKIVVLPGGFDPSGGKSN